MKLNLGMKYNLNVMKEISVTDSFLSLDETIRGCQDELFEECTNRMYKNALINECQCLPFQIRLEDDNVSKW